MSLRTRGLSRSDKPADPWDYKILRPNDEEFLHPLVGNLVPVDREWTRVAKWGGTLVGCYSMSRVAAEVFVLNALTVVREHRRRGLGSWLLAHAQAVVESSGGRRLEFRSVPCTSIFARSHFHESADGVVRFDTTAD